MSKLRVVAYLMHTTKDYLIMEYAGNYASAWGKIGSTLGTRKDFSGPGQVDNLIREKRRKGYADSTVDQAKIHAQLKIRKLVTELQVSQADFDAFKQGSSAPASGAAVTRYLKEIREWLELVPNDRKVKILAQAIGTCKSKEDALSVISDSDTAALFNDEFMLVQAKRCAYDMAHGQNAIKKHLSSLNAEILAEANVTEKQKDFLRGLWTASYVSLAQFSFAYNLFGQIEKKAAVVSPFSVARNVEE